MRIAKGCTTNCGNERERRDEKVEMDGLDRYLSALGCIGLALLLQCITCEAQTSPQQLDPHTLDDRMFARNECKFSDTHFQTHTFVHFRFDSSFIDLSIY